MTTESELESMWDALDDDYRYIIVKHCGNGVINTAGISYAEASARIGGTDRKDAARFRNAVMYMAGGRVGEMYVPDGKGWYKNALYLDDT